MAAKEGVVKEEEEMLGQNEEKECFGRFSRRRRLESQAVPEIHLSPASYYAPRCQGAPRYQSAPEC